MYSQGSLVGEDHLAVTDLVLRPAERVLAQRVAVDAEFGHLRHFDFRDQAARRRIAAGEFDAGRLANHAAPSVAADEVLRPQRRGVRQFYVDPGVVLGASGDLVLAVERDGQLGNPPGEDSLDVVLPQPQARTGGEWGSR